MCFFVVACDSLFKGEVNEVLLGDVYYLTKVKFLIFKEKLLNSLSWKNKLHMAFIVCLN